MKLNKKQIIVPAAIFMLIIAIFAYDCGYICNSKYVRNQVMIFPAVPNIRSAIEDLVKDVNGKHGKLLKILVMQFMWWNLMGYV